MIEGRNKFARITCRACGAMCPEENWNRRAALAAQPAEPVMTIGVDESEKCRSLPFGMKLYAQPAPAAVPPEGGIVVSKNEAGQIVCVSRQDEDGQFLSIIAESADAVPPGYVLVPVEPTYEINKAIRMAVRAGCFDDGIYRAMIAAAGDKP